MNKNSNKNDFVTKDYLDKRLKESKDYTDKRFDRLFTYLDHKFEPLNELKRDFDKFKDSTNKSLDWLVKSQEKYDQEYTVAQKQYSRTDERLNDHGKRISVLEKKIVYKTS